MSSLLNLRPCPALPRGLSGLSEAELAQRLYVRPLTALSGLAAAAALASGQGWSLAGSALVYSQCALLWLEDGTLFESVCGFADLLDWSQAEGDAVAVHVGRQLQRIGARRASFAGLDLRTPQVMGVVNVTPDSFSDGGAWFDPGRAVAHGLELREAGAAILDVGGESTRPGAAVVPLDEEIRRVVPVVRELVRQGALVSVDTRHAAVMAAALDAGAQIINDISALQDDPQALPLLAGSSAAIILMHMQGQPQTMQADPVYRYAPVDVYDHLAARVQACQAAGIAPERLCLDPGIGFGKTDRHNLQIMMSLGLLHGLGLPLLLGVSRKSLISRQSRQEPPGQRLPGSLALAQTGLEQGVQILRVHDVAETAQMLALWRACRAAA